jgi:peptidoglycan hydrolase-like protein with peptidoglycan-binding domain
MTMKLFMNYLTLAGAALAVMLALADGTPRYAYAQTAPSPILSEATVKALQEALNKQGIAIKTDGILDEETKAAVRKYQSQHHLPVTGEPDKATLDKLGVASAKSGEAPAAPTASGQAQTGSSQGMMMGPGHGMMGSGQGMMGPGHGMMGGGQPGPGGGISPGPGMPQDAPKQ